MAEKNVLCVPGSRYVIMEQFILKAGLPPPVQQVSPKLYQVYRRVSRVCDVQDMYYQGQRITGAPSNGQMLWDWLFPGTLTTRSTGEQLLAVEYAGFRASVQLTQQAISNVLVARPVEIDLGFIPTPYTYGRDPIPTVQLYGNPQAEFVSFGMITPLIAVAIYDPANGSLESPPARKRNEAIRGMLAQPDPAASGP